MGTITARDLPRLARAAGLSLVDYELLLVRRCPHYDRGCSAVECPLDPLQGQRGPVEEEKCRALRRTRLAIIAAAKAEGLDYPLRHGGRTEAEVAKDKRRAVARQRWEGLSEEQKQAFLERGKGAIYPRKESSTSAPGVSPLPQGGRVFETGINRPLVLPQAPCGECGEARPERA